MKESPTDKAITEIMEYLEKYGYVDTDWRDECTFEEDHREVIRGIIQKYI